MTNTEETDRFLAHDEEQKIAPTRRFTLLRHATVVAVVVGAALVLCIQLQQHVGLPKAKVAEAASMAAPTPLGTRKGSFIVFGDWGYDGEIHGNVLPTCQKLIGDKLLATMQELGDVKFILNVGDSFYPHGVTSKDDWQWDAKWRKVYAKELRSVPWYSVYGNHDMQFDPCACSDDPNQCAQVNYNISNLDHFYMPGFNWVKEHPELGLEVIGLEMNDYMWAWNKHLPPNSHCAWDCEFSKCQAKCETDYLWPSPEFIEGLSDNSKHHIEYFGGHRHNTDDHSTTSTAPNHNWLVGGGGGWSCDTPWGGTPSQQGFVVVEIGDDFKLSTRLVKVESKDCCKPPAPPAPPAPGPPWKPPVCKSME